MLQRSWPVVLLALAGVAAPVHGQVQFKWKLEPNDKFYLMTFNACEQNLEAPVDKSDFRLHLQAGELVLGAGASPVTLVPWLQLKEIKEAKQKREQTTYLRLRVLEKKDDRTVLELRILQTRLLFGETVVAKTFSDRLEKATFRVTLNPALEITQIEGYNDLLKQISGEDTEAYVGVLTGGLAARSTKSGDEAAALRSSMKAIVTEDLLKKSVTDILGYLPTAPVKEGQTWKREATEPLGLMGDCKRITEYKYDGKGVVAARTADKIVFTGTLTVLPAKTPPAGLPFEIVRADLRSDDVSGSIGFDVDNGRLIEVETRMTLKGPMTISVGGNKIDTLIQQIYTTTTRVLDKLPEDVKDD